MSGIKELDVLPDKIEIILSPNIIKKPLGENHKEHTNQEETPQNQYSVFFKFDIEYYILELDLEKIQAIERKMESFSEKNHVVYGLSRPLYTEARQLHVESQDVCEVKPNKIDAWKSLKDDIFGFIQNIDLGATPEFTFRTSATSTNYDNEHNFVLKSKLISHYYKSMYKPMPSVEQEDDER